MSYFDTRLGILNNLGIGSTPEFSPMADIAINSVFAYGLQNLGLGIPQAGNSTAQSTSNPFFPDGFIPQMNVSMSPTGGGGNWFDDFFNSLGSSMPWGVPGADSANNVGSVEVPSYVSKNNIDKIFGTPGKQGLNSEMRAKVIELIKRYHEKTGKTFEISESYRSPEDEKYRREHSDHPEMYAEGESQHSLGNAIDISRKTSSREDLDIIQHIWKYEMGSTIGMDFHAKKTRKPLNEYWHCDGRKDISRQSKAVQWTSGSSSAVASNGMGGGNSWDGGFGWDLSNLSGGFGGNLLEAMFGGSMGGGFGNSWGGGRSRTKALPSEYAPIVQKYADQYGVDAKLISSMIRSESSGDPTKVSSRGAKGLMQIMPCHYKRLGITNPYDPDQNIRGGTILMKEWLDKYHGDARTALAAYNWGPGNVDRLVRQYGSDNYDVIGRYVYSGTQAYAAKIINRYNSAGGSNNDGTMYA